MNKVRDENDTRYTIKFLIDKFFIKLFIRKLFIFYWNFYFGTCNSQALYII